MSLEFRNFASLVMGLRDRAVGNTTERITDDSDNIIWEQITRDTIASQIEYEIGRQYEIISNTPNTKENVETIGKAAIAIIKLNRARNVVNTLRLNGRFARIDQDKRWEASNIVAEVVTRRIYDVDDGTVTSDFLKLSDHIGTEIGYRRAQVNLK